MVMTCCYVQFIAALTTGGNPVLVSDARIFSDTMNLI